jgi:hypothetical protein
MDTTEGKLRDDGLQQAISDALGGKDERKEKGVPRIIVRFISLRRKLLDEDNLPGGFKDLLDGLRHASLIPDDSPKVIEFKAEQIKVRNKGKEGTLIQITYP